MHIIAGVALIVGGLSVAANLASPVPRPFAEILMNSTSALFAQVICHFYVEPVERIEQD